MRGGRLREALKNKDRAQVRCAAAGAILAKRFAVRIEASTRVEDFAWQPAGQQSRRIALDVTRSKILPLHNPKIAAQGPLLVEHTEAPGYGALAAGTPRSAMLSPFFREGTALTWRTTAETGARGAAITLPT